MTPISVTELELLLSENFALQVILFNPFQRCGIIYKSMRIFDIEEKEMKSKTDSFWKFTGCHGDDFITCFPLAGCGQQGRRRPSGGCILC